MDSRHRRGLWLGLDELEAGQSSRAAGEGRGAGKGGVAGKVQMGASGGQVGAARGAGYRSSGADQSIGSAGHSSLGAASSWVGSRAVPATHPSSIRTPPGTRDIINLFTSLST